MTKEKAREVRQHRLERLNKFAAYNIPLLERMACHLLLTAYFKDSNWKTVWFCLRVAVTGALYRFQGLLKIFWYQKIRRFSDEEIDAHLLGIEPKISASLEE